ncbi:MAG: hypothetical protein J7K22_01885 [Nanoarchaeota archaeon]|nr:hypothetical protein [Nanoarchaeota archaeon]
MKYSDAGVNNQLGNEASKILYEAAKKTWKVRKNKLGEVITPNDDFSGIRYINVSNLPKGTVMNINFDGIGTKVEIAERLGKYNTLGFDLIAMVCDDAVARGGEPVLVGSILDVNSLDIEIIKQIAEGYLNAAAEAGVAIVNGELAQLGERIKGYGKFNLNWGAACVWFAKQDRLLPKKLEEGDYLVGLKEYGLRSNGFSLARKILKENYGDEWHEECDAEYIADWLLTPSTIYTRAIVEMFGGVFDEPKADIKAFVHVTGGGIPEKLGRILKPTKLGAYIEKIEVPQNFRNLQAIGKVSDEEAYKTWNMGVGGIVITENPNDVIDIAYKHGINAYKIGYLTKDDYIFIEKGNGAEEKYGLRFKIR